MTAEVRSVVVLIVLTADSNGTDRLTQLIALTGSSGSWRKTIIDKSIAFVTVPLLLAIVLTSEIHTAGLQRMVHVQPVIKICITT